MKKQDKKKKKKKKKRFIDNMTDLLLGKRKKRDQLEKRWTNKRVWKSIRRATSKDKRRHVRDVLPRLGIYSSLAPI
jgi:hypothetical protein